MTGGGAGPAPQLGIREAWRPHRGSGLRPRSPATCIPNPQAVLMGGRCFHSGCFWRAAVASLAAPRAEARAHTGPPRAPLALGRCAGGGGGAGAWLAFPLLQSLQLPNCLRFSSSARSSLAPRERCPPPPGRAHALKLFSRQQILF